jgi:hypothetical protein
LHEEYHQVDPGYDEPEEVQSVDLITVRHGLGIEEAICHGQVMQSIGGRFADANLGGQKSSARKSGSGMNTGHTSGRIIGRGSTKKDKKPKPETTKNYFDIMY